MHRARGRKRSSAVELADDLIRSVFAELVINQLLPQTLKILSLDGVVLTLDLWDGSERCCCCQRSAIYKLLNPVRHRSVLAILLIGSSFCFALSFCKSGASAERLQQQSRNLNASHFSIF